MMSEISRREMLKAGTAITIGMPASLLLGPSRTRGSHPEVNSPNSRLELFPRLLRHDMIEACIDLGSSIPTPYLTSRFEHLLKQAAKSRRVTVIVEGRITPVADRDGGYSPWIELCERHGVNAITERSDREPLVTPPLRIGQIDPAGIVYQITSRINRSKVSPRV